MKKVILAKPISYIRNARLVRMVGSSAMFCLLILTAALLAPVYNVQNLAEATTGTATESSLTFTSINPTASVSLSVSDPSGTFASSANDQMAKFSISTTNYTGYTVTVKSTNGNTLSNGTNTLTALGETVTPANFALATNTKYNNKWGILPNYYDSAVNTSYLSMPASGSLTLDETSAANATAKEYTIALGVRADYAYTESTYYNTFVIEYVANQINYVINYDANAGTDTVTNMPISPQTGYTNATSITIASETPEREKYEFKGWCTVATSDESCSGMTYQPGATYGIDQTASNEITLHAMWEKGLPDLQIQNLASSACTATPTEVYDARDNEVYTVTRLADGKCWMTTNLNLRGGTVIDSTTSDVPEGYTLNTSYGFQVGNKLPASSISGFNDDVKAFVYNSNSVVCKTDSPCYSYYSWLAATAGSGANITTYNTDAPYSICPKGWKLPNTYDDTYGSTTSYTAFRALMVAYGGSNTIQFYSTSTTPTGATMYNKISANPAPNFLLSGYYNVGTFSSGGSYGYYWSSTALNSTTAARSLYFTPTSVGAAASGGRRNGYAIRCVMDETLQGFTQAKADALEVGDTLTLYDNRDGESYTVGKLADGNVWLLDNLRLNPTSATLTPSNTNVTSAVSTTFINKATGWTDSADSYTSAWYNLERKTNALPYGSGSNYVGGYYNYCAASAGTYCVSKNQSSGNASSDLCPVGWRMPTGGASGEYEALYKKYGAYSPFKEALRTGLYGTFWYNSYNDQGSYGYFWTSTLYSTGNMYSMRLSQSDVQLNQYYLRSNGYSVRCILKAGTEMQGATSVNLASKLVNVGGVTTLVDTRDYQPYTVAKLADNKIWMTKNLNLPGGTEIESTKSDVPEDYILNTSYGFQSGNKLPASATAGFNDDAKAFVYNSNSTTCGDNSPCYSYYSWTAATVGSGAGLVSENTDAPYSICPKGWKLPNTYNNGSDATTDLRALMIAYGGSSAIQIYTDTTSPTGRTLYNKIGPGTLSNFLLTGSYSNGAFNSGGLIGLYWSSTIVDNTYSLDMMFHSNGVYAAFRTYARNGFAIRCLLAN